MLENAIAAIGSAEERSARLEEQMKALLESWPMKPVVQALMGMRGLALVGAMGRTSELGEAWRCEHPRQLMACLGLVPSENTSSEQRRQGGSTKTGHSHARWLLIEAAHHDRLAPKISKELSVRPQGLSPEIKACAWKAQTRLHQRMMALLARGKQRHKVLVAVARELVGFVWQIFQRMAPRMTQAQGAALQEGSRLFGGNEETHHGASPTLTKGTHHPAKHPPNIQLEPRPGSWGGGHGDLIHEGRWRRGAARFPTLEPRLSRGSR